MNNPGNETNNESFHIELLKNRYLMKKNKNSRYSLRAYANFLDLDASSLSKIFAGKRKFPVSRANHVSTKLSLSKEEFDEFLLSVVEQQENKLVSNQVTLKDWTVLDEKSHYQLIADWEYYAILNISELDNFSHTVKEVSERLGIEVTRAEEVINDLFEVGLLKELVCGKWIPTNKSLNTSNDISSEALKEGHRQELLLAMDSLIHDSVEERGFYSVSVVTNKDAIAKAKKMTSDFIDKIMLTLEKGPKSEVYQVCAHLFPITKKRKTNH